MLLRNENMPRKNRKIKAYCYHESVNAIRSLEQLRAADAESCPLFTLSDQAALLRDALKRM